MPEALARPQVQGLPRGVVDNFTELNPMTFQSLFRPLTGAACLAVLASAAPLASAQTGTSVTPVSSIRTAATNRNGYSLLPMTTQGYVGLNVGRTDFKTPCGRGYGCDDSDASAYLYTGGLINEWLGAEIGYFYGGKAPRAGGTTKVQGLNLGLVLRAPIGAFNAFVKGGAIYGQTSVSSAEDSEVGSGKRRGWGASYGAGVGYDFTPQSGVVLEFARKEFRFPAGGRHDVDTTSLGYVMRF